MMKTLYLFSSLVLWSGIASAQLQTLDNQQLQQVEGQASAATINWTLSLNQTSPGVFDTTTCSDLRFCRFAVSLNNSGITDNKKKWFVFKGMQGTIQMKNIQIDGTDLIYKDKTLTDQIKAALQVTFSVADPIKIRNLGFNALSIESDTVANEGAGNVSGYLAMGSGGTGVSAFANGVYTNTTNKFDQDRETGFTGLMMNGNLAMQGTLKIFSCDQSMSRC
jgi:hypothetical protein